MQLWADQSGKVVGTNEPYTSPNGTTYPPNFPKSEITGLSIYTPQAPTQPELDAQLAALKAAKNLQINTWRGDANRTSFVHLTKTISCDALSRSDIDAVAGSIALTGAFPVGFPGAWKAMDNTYLMLPDVNAFKALYASMTLQGTANFARSQELKATLAAATTVEQVNAIVW